MQYLTATTTFSLFNPPFLLHQHLEEFAAKYIEAEGDLNRVQPSINKLCHLLIDCSPYFDSADHYGDVWKTEEEANEELGLGYEEDAAKYSSLEDEDKNEQVNSGWLVLTISICTERSRPLENIECEVKDSADLINLLKQVAFLASEERLRAFNLHWSPATREENITDDQIIEYYPELKKL